MKFRDITEHAGTSPSSNRRNEHLGFRTRSKETKLEFSVPSGTLSRSSIRQQGKLLPPYRANSQVAYKHFPRVYSRLRNQERGKNPIKRIYIRLADALSIDLFSKWHSDVREWNLFPRSCLRCTSRKKRSRNRLT